MKLSEIYKTVKAHYPENLAMEWDNPGILAGNPEQEINTVLVTLDITPSVVKEAVSRGAELILSHHPLLFSGINNFREDNFKNKMYAEIIRNKIAVISAHTNMDCAEKGINQRLAEKLGLKKIAVLEEETCLGRIGETEETTISEFSEKLKRVLGTPFLKLAGDADRKITKVAIGSGSCGDIYPIAVRMGAELFITADVKYHIALDAAEEGLALIDAGHYPTEIIVTEMFEEILKGVKVIKAKSKDIFSCI